MIGGNALGNKEYADILRQIIAYSVIEHEETEQGEIVSQSVFGDTAISALYEDANNFGLALKSADINLTWSNRTDVVQ